MLLPRHRVALTGIFALLMLAVGFVWHAKRLVPHPERVEWGVTFSAKYARSLGLDARAAYLAVLDDLKVRRLRLPVYWDEVERERGTLDWSEVDWLLTEAGDRGVEVTLALGARVPRYPECHLPEWIKNKAPVEREEQLLRYVQDAITHLRTFEAITAWQVENEPSLPYFGVCPPPNPSLLRDEIKVARELSTLPIIETSSGEFGNWAHDAEPADALGVSLYRSVYVPHWGPFTYPIPSWWYSLRARSLPAGKGFFLSELQGEPWLQGSLATEPIEAQIANFSPAALHETIAYAREAGFAKIDLWGVEWWYFMKEKHAHPEYWQEAKGLFAGGVDKVEKAP